MTQLLGVLSRDKNKAWNPEGIREELFGEETNVVEKDCQIDNIHRILLRLVEEGTVEAKQIEMEGGELEFFYVLK